MKRKLSKLSAKFLKINLKKSDPLIPSPNPYGHHIKMFSSLLGDLGENRKFHKAKIVSKKYLLEKFMEKSYNTPKAEHERTYRTAD